MNQNLKTVIIGASILGVAVALYFVGKKSVKKFKDKKEAERKAKVEAELGLGDSSPAAQVEEEQAKSYNPSSDLKSLANYVVGYNVINAYEDEVNGLIATLSTAELKILAAAFKKKYNKSLYRYLDDEMDGCGFWGYSNCYEPSMKRLSNAGLR